MNDQDLEKYLNGFKLAEPPAGLRERVLSAIPSESAELSPAFVFGVKIFLSAAAIILVAIIALNSLSLSRPGADTKKFDAATKQLEQLDIPRDRAAAMIAIGEAARQSQAKLSRKGNLS